MCGDVSLMTELCANEAAPSGGRFLAPHTQGSQKAILPTEVKARQLFRTAFADQIPSRVFTSKKPTARAGAKKKKVPNKNVFRVNANCSAANSKPSYVNTAISKNDTQERFNEDFTRYMSMRLFVVPIELDIWHAQKRGQH